ncbi:hypothetical protein ACJZ2D_014045 [Fusarium nematophilum]
MSPVIEGDLKAIETYGLTSLKSGGEGEEREGFPETLSFRRRHVYIYNAADPNGLVVGEEEWRHELEVTLFKGRFERHECFFVRPGKKQRSKLPFSLLSLAGVASVALMCKL